MLKKHEFKEGDAVVSDNPQEILELYNLAHKSGYDISVPNATPSVWKSMYWNDEIKHFCRATKDHSRIKNIIPKEDFIKLVTTDIENVSNVQKQIREVIGNGKEELRAMQPSIDDLEAQIINEYALYEQSKFPNGGTTRDILALSVAFFVKQITLLKQELNELKLNTQ